MERKRELALRYFEAAGSYEELGGDDNLKRALELYEKGIAISERLVKSMLQSYKQYKSKENTAINKHLVKPKLLQDIENRKGIPNTGTNEIVIQSERELIDVYTKIAKLLEKLGGDDNLAKAHERNRQALEIEELLEVTLQVLEDEPPRPVKPTPSVIKFGGFLHPHGDFPR